MPFTLKILPCRTDNYIWLFHNSSHAWVVDPSLAAPVQDYIAQHGLILADILITHHHFDHVEGIKDLLPLLQGRVIGSSQRIHELTENLIAPCHFKLSFIDAEIQMMPTHGHTYDHISYYLADLLGEPILFCGDTIFSAGCGRLFDGNIEQLFHSFNDLMKLPSNTRIACAHEYTLANLAFALAIDSAHPATQQHNIQVKYALARGLPSLPSTLAIEKCINPYMRCIEFDPAWIDALTEFASRRGATNVDIRSPLDAFTLCRQLKNTF